MDLSIIMVNYNTRELTLNALRSVYQSKTQYSYEVILVDNHSMDDSVPTIRQLFPQVDIIENDENVGYARANNQAMRIAKGDFFLLLNTDTILESDSLDIMISYIKNNKQVGAAGCKIILTDGTLDKACRRGFPTPIVSFCYMSGLSRLFPKSPVMNRYHMGHLDPDNENPVDCLVGAFMIVRREAINEVGLLDEQFFMYGEDIDWCYRIKEAGWEIMYYPKATIVHYKRASSYQKPIKIIYEFHRAMYLFYKKHYKAKYPIIVTWVMYIAIACKLLISLIKNKLLLRKKPGTSY